MFRVRGLASGHSMGATSSKATRVLGERVEETLQISRTSGTSSEPPFRVAWSIWARQWFLCEGSDFSFCFLGSVTTSSGTSVEDITWRVGGSGLRRLGLCTSRALYPPRTA